MNESKFLSTSQAATFFNVSPNTIRSWDKHGYIKTIRLNGSPYGQRRFDISSFNGTSRQIINEHSIIPTNNVKKGIIYCRVSSKHQIPDLERQIQKLQTLYPTYEVIKDVASGINFKRPGFLKLFQRAISRDFNEIVVAHRDRFTRFGFEFFEWLFQQFEISFVVLDNSNFKTPEQELSEDLLSIIHIFSCRQNGKRKYKIQKNDIPGDTSNDTSE